MKASLQGSCQERVVQAAARCAASVGLIQRTRCTLPSSSLASHRSLRLFNTLLRFVTFVFVVVFYEVEFTPQIVEVKNEAFEVGDFELPTKRSCRTKNSTVSRKFITFNGSFVVVHNPI